MSNTTFVPGTVIASTWLNDVNSAVYKAGSGLAGSPTVRTALQRGTDSVSVKDYGAVGDGTTDDTAAFSAALAVSTLVEVPYTASSYLINNLNVPVGSRLYGAGNIKTSGGTIIDLATVNLEEQGGPEKMMFIESDHQGWEEMLDIKACGYNTIMAYLWNGPTLDHVIYNAEAVGLKVIVHSKFLLANIATWNALATAATLYDSRTSVVGYYVFDEPIGGSINVTNQDSGITIFRALTNKPLMCTETTVEFAPTGFLSLNFDVVYLDQYYANSYGTGNSVIQAYLSSLACFGQITKAKMVPCVGLFNDTGFTKSTTVTAAIADVIGRFSIDGGFAVFNWNAGTAGTYQGVRNVAAYRTAAKIMATEIPRVKKWQTEFIPVGNVFTSSNRLANIYYNTTDNATPGLPAASNIVPWATVNAGSNINLRQRTFADNGLMVQGTTGRMGFAGMPSGMCMAYLRWDNRTNGGTISVSIGASDNLGYTTTAGFTLSIPTATAGANCNPVDTSGQFVKMPTLDFTLGGSSTFPNDFLKGYLFFTNIPGVSY